MNDVTDKRTTLYSDVRLKLPRFALLVLRRRAKRQGRTLSDVLESLVWDAIWMDEVQAVTNESPEAARAFKAWFTFAVKRRKKK